MQTLALFCEKNNYLNMLYAKKFNHFTPYGDKFMSFKIFLFITFHLIKIRNLGIIGLYYI